jgi:signal transduction histidine kinase
MRASAGLCFYLLLLSQAAAAAEPARDPVAPQGSYRLSCDLIEARDDILQAVCQRKDDDWVQTKLLQYTHCSGDIANEDGALTCRRESKRKSVPFFGPPEFGFRGTTDGLYEAGPLGHETWTSRDGAPLISALAQTSDGFLWTGSSTGLFRFDGNQFELFHSAFGERLLSTNISSLYAPPSGGLWIGYLFGGVSFLDKGHVRNFPELGEPGGSVRYIRQDKDGAVWAAADELWRLGPSGWQRVGSDWNFSLHDVSDLELDQDGNLWISGGEGSLLRLSRGGRRFELVQQNEVFDRHHYPDRWKFVDREGNIWFWNEKSLHRFFSSPLLQVKSAKPETNFGSALSVDDGGWVWACVSESLYRASHAKIQMLPKHEWATFATYRAPDGTAWIGAQADWSSPHPIGGLWQIAPSPRVPSGESRPHGTGPALGQDLWRFSGRTWRFVELPGEVANHSDYIQALTQDRSGGLWVSLGGFGQYRYADGVWTPDGGRKDFPKRAVVSEFTDRQGRVWFGLEKGGLAVLDGDRLQVFGPADGVHVGNIMAINGRGTAIWLGGEFGLLQYESGHFTSIHAANDDLLGGISGIVETTNGDLWLNGHAGIFHVRHAEIAQALAGPSHEVKGEHFGRRDGLPGVASQLRPLPTAIEATDGRLWFAVSEGVVSLDPARADRRHVAPAVAIESVSADGKFYTPAPEVVFPAHASDVQIGYAAVSLSDPEAVHVRYKLDEIDSDWREVGSARLATFRNLAPGDYHFRISSTDTNGVWSDRLATIRFSILPAFYQTTWFRSLLAVAAAVLLWMIFAWRLAQERARMRARLDERLAERERIARELHDTFLQGVQGLMLKFQSAMEKIPPSLPARDIMEKALDRADDLLAEGRDRVTQLRTMHRSESDLAMALQAVGTDLARDSQVGFRLTVEGARQELDPVVNDELRQIAGEALANAFHHAHAHRVDVTVTYARRQLVIRIVDDGRGFEYDTGAKQGPAGHWGLKGMHERAEKIHASLAISSAPDVGTAIEVRVPSPIAFRPSSKPWRGWLHLRRAK